MKPDQCSSNRKYVANPVAKQLSSPTHIKRGNPAPIWQPDAAAAAAAERSERSQGVWGTRLLRGEDADGGPHRHATQLAHGDHIGVVAKGAAEGLWMQVLWYEVAARPVAAAHGNENADQKEKGNWSKVHKKVQPDQWLRPAEERVRTMTLMRKQNGQMHLRLRPGFRRQHMVFSRLHLRLFAVGDDTCCLMMQVMARKAGTGCMWFW